jgi:hypothetical protein
MWKDARHERVWQGREASGQAARLVQELPREGLQDEEGAEGSSMLKRLLVPVQWLVVPGEFLVVPEGRMTAGTMLEGLTTVDLPVITPERAADRASDAPPPDATTPA